MSRRRRRRRGEEADRNNLVFYKEIYCTENMYIMLKDKLQNCSLNQFE
jgi:hypothetical protein